MSQIKPNRDLNPNATPLPSRSSEELQIDFMFYDILSKEYLQPEEAVPFFKFTKFSHSKETRIEHVEILWMVRFVLVS